MRILQVNKFHYPRGGADKYYLELSQALENAGHQVANFSMQHPKNIPSIWSKYFVSRLSFNEASLLDKLKTPGRMIYSLEAKKKFTRLLEDFQPDIIHLHNIYHQISPSILDVARQQQIPVLMHVHDYKLICPNYQLFAQGKICEACKPNKYWRCLQKRCFKNSYTKSALASLEMYLHHNWWKIYEKNLKILIAPSQFMKNKLIEFNWPETKIKVIVNPYSSSLSSSSTVKSNNKNKYILYFGRLSQEKGIDTLVRALTITKKKLKLVGTGPDENRLRSLVQKFKLDVDFLGFKEGTELSRLISASQAVIIPSIWYENMPLSMLEALSLKKPVIASNIGGLPELIKSGKNGWLFEAGNVQALADCLSMLDQANLPLMGKEAQASVLKFTLSENLKQVINVYNTLLNK